MEVEEYAGGKAAQRMRQLKLQKGNRAQKEKVDLEEEAEEARSLNALATHATTSTSVARPDATYNGDKGNSRHNGTANKDSVVVTFHGDKEKQSTRNSMAHNDSVVVTFHGDKENNSMRNSMAHNDSVVATFHGEKEQSTRNSMAHNDSVGVTFLAQPSPTEPSLLERHFLCERESETTDEAKEDSMDSFALQAHYMFDNLMAKNSTAFLGLAVIALIIVTVGGIFNYLCGGEAGENVSDGMWNAWAYMADPGTQGAAAGIARLPASVISVLGMFFSATMLGFVVDIVRLKLEELRKGKSIVIESEHTLILGWTDKIYTLLAEICDANETRPNGSHGGVIVILCDTMSKSEMEQELAIRLPIPTRQGSRFVCRVGSPMSTVDLEKVAVQKSRSIVALCEVDGEPEKADSSVLRVVLSLCSLLKGSGSHAHIVAEIRDVDSKPLLKVVGKERIETVVSHDIVGRLMILAVRQPGLASIYEEVLGFDGDEFYMQEWPTLCGVPFGDLAVRFPGAVVIGVKTADGAVVLKPASTRLVRANEEIIVIAEDDDTYDLVEASESQTGRVPPDEMVRRSAEKILFCGWRRDARDMLMLLDDLTARGTEIHIMCQVPLDQRAELLADSGLDMAQIRNISIVHHLGNTTARRHLEKLPVQDFTSCLIVADEMLEQDLMNSDSHCITTLLLINDIQQRRRASVRSHIPKCPMLCEILDARTQDSICSNDELNDIGEFVRSNEMVSRVLAMVAEDRSVNCILDELLGGHGCSFSLQPAQRYLGTAETISFMELSHRALQLGDILCGYQEPATALEAATTVMNPRDKSKRMAWEGTMLVVLVGSPMHPDLHDNTLHSVVVVSEWDVMSRARSTVEETFGVIETIETIGKMFDRYDVEQVGSLDSQHQLEQLSLNVAMKLKMKISATDMEAAILGLPPVSDENAWTKEDFQEWFLSTFMQDAF